MGAGRSRRRRFLRAALLAAVVLLVAIQFVPYGWSKPNPPVRAAAVWPDEESERIARSSCYACHSNQTDWPVYSYVAPMSWLVRRDVERGRDELNFSAWDDDSGEADDAIETIEDSSMPPRQYTLLHPDARLDDDESAALIEALRRIGEGD